MKEGNRKETDRGREKKTDRATGKKKDRICKPMEPLKQRKKEKIPASQILKILSEARSKGKYQVRYGEIHSLHMSMTFLISTVFTAFSDTSPNSWTKLQRFLSGVKSGNGATH